MAYTLSEILNYHLGRLREGLPDDAVFEDLKEDLDRYEDEQE